MGYFFAYHFFPYTKQNINSKETQRGSCEGGKGKPILVPKWKKGIFSIRLHQNTNNENWKKKWPPHLSIFLDLVSYQDPSRPSASLAHCCIHDNLYFLAYFAFLNHKCKIKATKTNQVEKELNWTMRDTRRLCPQHSGFKWYYLLVTSHFLFCFVLFFCRCWFYLFRCMEHAVLHSCVMLRSLILDRKMFSHFYCWICYERDRWKI